MTVNTLKKLMKQHKLTQQAAADLMEVAQPTLHDIIHERHGLTEKNISTFRRNLARTQAMQFSAQGYKVPCAANDRKMLSKRQFIEHLPECAPCLSRAFSGPLGLQPSLP